MKMFSVDSTRKPRPHRDFTVERGHNNIFNQVWKNLFTFLLVPGKEEGLHAVRASMRDKVIYLVNKELDADPLLKIFGKIWRKNVRALEDVS